MIFRIKAVIFSAPEPLLLVPAFVLALLLHWLLQVRWKKLLPAGKSERLHLAGNCCGRWVISRARLGRRWNALAVRCTARAASARERGWTEKAAKIFLRAPSTLPLERRRARRPTALIS